MNLIQVTFSIVRMEVTILLTMAGSAFTNQGQKLLASNNVFFIRHYCCNKVQSTS